MEADRLRQPFRAEDLGSWARLDDGDALATGLISQIPGQGAKYLVAFTDGAGTPVSGGATYRAKLRPNIPAANFRSVTLSEAENASRLANGQPFPSLGSRDKPAPNADGSTDRYLGPTAPEGKGANWLATVPGKGYFGHPRNLQGPERAGSPTSGTAA